MWAPIITNQEQSQKLDEHLAGFLATQAITAITCLLKCLKEQVSFINDDLFDEYLDNPKGIKEIL